MNSTFILAGGWLLLGFFLGFVCAFRVYPKVMRLWMQRGKVVLKSCPPCAACGTSISDWDDEEDDGELPICEDCGGISGPALTALYMKEIDKSQKVVDRLAGRVGKLKRNMESEREPS